MTGEFDQLKRKRNLLIELERRLLFGLYTKKGIDKSNALEERIRMVLDEEDD